MALPPILPRTFYARPTLTVARDLLGTMLVHTTVEGVTAGRVVEVEAYIGEDDPACHAAAGCTARSQPLYGPPGHAYVYLNYGMHYLVNAVTEDEGRPAAVLIRALEPVAGLPLMRQRRRHRRTGEVPDSALCRGPGNVGRAMGIGTAQNRAPLTGGALTIRAGEDARPVVWTPRIGITVASERYWRCAVRDSAAVSGVRDWLRRGRTAPWPARTAPAWRRGARPPR
jgi:DNA-3-methyladenine glycosylase